MEAIELVLSTIILQNDFEANETNDLKYRTMKSNKDREITQKDLYWFGQPLCLRLVSNSLLRFL